MPKGMIIDQDYSDPVVATMIHAIERLSFLNPTLGSNIFRFNDPQTYWQALTEQEYCYQHDYSQVFPSLFRPKHEFDTDAMPALQGHSPIATQIKESYYSSSLLENTAYLFAAAVAFRFLDILWYKAKSNFIQKKYERNQFDWRFEALSIASTAIVANTLSMPEFYIDNIAIGLVIRGIGYALKNRFAKMDYAEDINLIYPRNEQALKDFLSLKFYILAGTVMSCVGYCWLLSFIPASYHNPLNGVYATSSDEISCVNNTTFMRQFATFNELFSHVGALAGPLAVDLALTGMKQVGILKDPNNFTIDPNYRQNIIDTGTRAFAVVARRVRTYTHNTDHELPPAPIVDKKVPTGGRKNARPVDQPKHHIEKTSVVIIPEPTLTLGNAVILTDGSFNKYPNVATFAINLANQADMFNTALHKDIAPIKMLSGIRTKKGRPVYELQSSGDPRLLGTLLESSTAIEAITRLSDQAKGSAIGSEFDDCTAKMGKQKWCCLVFEKSAQKHGEIYAAARSMS